MVYCCAQQDGLQWILDEAFATNDPAELDATRLSHRLLYVNDISLHSTSYTVQNLILDLYSSKETLGIIEDLREESERVLKEAGGEWTREAVTKLKLVDATIRESMRMTPFASVGLPRTVSCRYNRPIINRSAFPLPAQTLEKH
jgi:hypothetical protein